MVYVELPDVGKSFKKGIGLLKQYRSVVSLAKICVILLRAVCHSLCACAIGEVFASVESVKAAGSVYAPVDLEVIQVNAKLNDTPGLVNEGPFEKGHLIKVCAFRDAMDRPPHSPTVCNHSGQGEEPRPTGCANGRDCVPHAHAEGREALSAAC